MRSARGWIAVVVCCAVAGAEETPPDRSLAQAQRDLDEARKIDKPGELVKAVSLFERALEIREKARGPNHPEVAECLHLLGDFYRHQRKFVQAEPLIQRALQIREVALGKNHPDVAQSLTSLASIYRFHGLYDRAEALYLRALQIQKAALGEQHLKVGRTLADLGILYWGLGLYDQADSPLERGLHILEAARGRNHTDVAAALNNLAVLYVDQGSYDRAESLLLRSLQIYQAAQGPVALPLGNLAALYVAQGSYDRAEPLVRRALQLYETAPGDNRYLICQSLQTLGDLYLAQGFYDRAEPLYLRALHIAEAYGGQNRADVADSVNALADLYRAQGFYDRAEALYLRVLQIREATYGKNPPNISELLRSIAQLHIATGRLTSAWPLLQRSFAISEARLRGESVAFAELRLDSFLSLLRTQEQTHYNLLREHPSEGAVLRLALATALLRKGRSASEIADTSRAVYRSLGPSDRDTFQRLRALRTEFSSLSLAKPEPLSPAAYQTRLQELQTQADTLEAELAQRSAPLRVQRQLPGPDDIIARVAATLPPDGALVELLAFSASPVVPPLKTPPAQMPSTPVYFALVLLPSGDIRAVDLGPAEAIDGAVRRLHLSLSSQAENYLPAAQELHRLVFQPLQPLLGAQRRLFIAPDGQLNLVSFDALHDGTRFLVDAFDITYLTSGKDLVRTAEDAPVARSVVVLADPDFGTAPSAPAHQRGEAATLPAPALLERSAPVETFFAHPRAGLTDEPWEPLPGTRQEAEAIHQILPQARLLLGAAATKQALLEVAAPGILHIATHGFFLDAAAGPQKARGRVSVGAPPETPPAQLLLSDPLLRAGLVLAGAQGARFEGRGAENSRAQDTLATALELAGVNLWGTELVVLSACDTGRGEVKPGLGVYGLRRAFTVAGAETLVTSLWKVNDQTTHLLMKDFYQQLKAGRGRAEALRAAMRRMRERQAHPYYWAPFILIGNGAPLRSLGFAPSPIPSRAP